MKWITKYLQNLTVYKLSEKIETPLFLALFFSLFKAPILMGEEINRENHQEESRIHCSGILLSTYSAENEMTILKETLSDKLKPLWNKSLLVFKNLKLAEKNEFIISVSVKEKKDFVHPKKLLPLITDLASLQFRSVELDCHFKDDYLPLKNHLGGKELSDRYCMDISAEKLTKNSLYYSCDPRWPLKMVGSLQLNEEKDWSDDWIEEFKTKEQEHIIKPKIAIISNNISSHPEIGPFIPELIESQSLQAKEDLEEIEEDDLGPSLVAILQSPPERQFAGFLNEGPSFQFIEGVNPNSKIVIFRPLASQGLPHISQFELIKIVNMITQINQKASHLSEKINFLIIKQDYPLPSKILKSVFKNGEKNGLTIVVASNDYISELKKTHINLSWPAHYEDLISVSGVDVYGNPWKESGYGENIDLAAPAENIFALGQQKSNDVYNYGVVRKSSNLFAATYATGIFSYYLHLFADEVVANTNEKISQSDLIHYLISKMANKTGSNLYCDRNIESCEIIGLGQYGKGIINLKRILDLSFPKISILEEWKNREFHEKYDVLLNSHDLQFFFQNIKLFISESKISSKSSPIIFMELFDLEKEDLGPFIQKNGYSLIVLLMSSQRLQKLFINYWSLYEKLIDLRIDENKNKKEIYLLKIEMEKNKFQLMVEIQDYLKS